MAKKESAVLQEHDVQRLNDYQHARLRTEMYLGSRSVHESQVLIFGESGYEVKNVEWVPAILTATREIIDNSLDEFKKLVQKSQYSKLISMRKSYPLRSVIMDVVFQLTMFLSIRKTYVQW
ncbi:UNVERIFIED_ORG: hypothetical protein [Escherichia phage CMSTMSU]